MLAFLLLVSGALAACADPETDDTGAKHCPDLEQRLERLEEHVPALRDEAAELLELVQADLGVEVVTDTEEEADAAEEEPAELADPAESGDNAPDEVPLELGVVPDDPSEG